MSGGSHGYVYSSIDYELVGNMKDREMDDLMKDIVKVAHDIEWWDSSDISEDTYRKTVREFKEKWFGSNREERLKGYVDDAISDAKKEMYKLLGIVEDKNE